MNLVEDRRREPTLGDCVYKVDRFPPRPRVAPRAPADFPSGTATTRKEGARRIPRRAMPATHAVNPDFVNAAAPESAASTDGMTRSMLAMALFNEAKEEYTALAAKGQWEAGGVRANTAFHTKWAAQCYEFAVNHGGLYIKASQFITSLQNSSEAAGVPREYVEALRPLTDSVPPRPFDQVASVAAEELGKPLSKFVKSIEEQPIAAASLAQVHKATVSADKLGTAEGSSSATSGGGGSGGGGPVTVAVKLQYPMLREQIAADFEVMNMMQSMVAPTGYDFSWLLLDLQKYVTSELDFATEAKNTQAASDALRSLAPGVLVPSLVPALCSSRTLCTEFITGLTRLDKPSDLKALSLEPKALGDLCAAMFCELWLVHGLVHGDPHAGNVYCRPHPASRKPQVILLDHGLYHHLTDADRINMCEMILAAATPWPSCGKVMRLAKHFAGALAPLFPALISPAFAFSTGMSLRQLRAASEGRLPAGTTLDDVWQTLVAMHNGESDVIGLLHSMGYVRGLLNALNYDEKPRVLALTRCATRAVCSHRHKQLKAPRLALALALTATRVHLLFVLLFWLRLMLRVLDMLCNSILACVSLCRRLTGGGRVTPE